MKLRSEETKRSRTYEVPFDLPDGSTAKMVMTLSVQCQSVGSDAGVCTLFEEIAGKMDVWTEERSKATPKIWEE